MSELVLSLLNDELVLKHSHGEVKNFGKHLNYGKVTAEKDGLFCEKIFGPMRDYTCSCGITRKYKTLVTCHNCGVDYVSSSERRNRFGHVELNTYILPPLSVPAVAKIWGISKKLLENFTNFSRKGKDKPKKRINLRFVESDNGVFWSKFDKRYHLEYDKENKSEDSFDNFYMMMKKAKELEIDPKISMMQNKSESGQIYFERGYDIFDFLLTKFPISPPANRDRRTLDDKAFYGEDNLLYTRIIRSSQRIKSLKLESEVKSEDYSEIISYETKVIQKLINDLIVNGYRITNNKKVNPRIEKIGGKSGILRGESLGKRIDFSGRSVITSDPFLKVDEIGIPIDMLHELFTPEILRKLSNMIMEESPNLTKSSALRKAKLEHKSRSKRVISLIYEFCERDKLMVIMNRAPSLHRYSVMSFNIKPTNSKCLYFPPFACKPFNADCLSENQKIHTLEWGGKTVPELMKIVKPGEHFYVWSRDENGIQVPGKAHSPRYVRNSDKLYRITLDNGETIECTENHQFKMKDLSYTEAKNLKIGDSVSPFRFDSKLSFGGFMERPLETYLKTRNHKIQAIKITHGDFPVYDITVEDYHNYALSAGCYTHNCDGDTLAVYLMHSKEAREELKKLVSFRENFMSSVNFDTPSASYSHEQIVGSYLLTRGYESKDWKDKRPVKYYNSVNDAIKDYELGYVKLEDKVVLILSSNKYELTLGSILIFQNCGLLVNYLLDKSGISKLITEVCMNYSTEVCVNKFSRLQSLFFDIATKYGLSVCGDDCKVSSEFKDILSNAKEEGVKVDGMDRAKIWNTAINTLVSKWQTETSPDNPFVIMGKAGVRVTPVQIRAMMVGKGLQTNMDGSLNCNAIDESLYEGLGVINYFRTCGPARKGFTQNAMIVPASGYLTRQFVRACEDLVITTEDCGSKTGQIIDKKFALYRYDMEGNLITPENIHLYPEIVEIRSPTTCKHTNGLCSKCCGLDPAYKRPFHMNTGVGVIAAQSFSEKTSQLAMRGKHESGAVTLETFGNQISDILADLIGYLGGDSTMGVKANRFKGIWNVKGSCYSEKCYNAIKELREIMLDENGKTFTSVWYEILLRALSDIVFVSGKPIGYRHKGVVDGNPVIRNLNQVNTNSPSWLKCVSFGYVKDTITRTVEIAGKTQGMMCEKIERGIRITDD